MILTDGTDTREPSYKYDSGMAIYLERKWMDGDTGDDSVGNVDTFGHFVRYGRRVMVSECAGFVGLLTFPTIEDADDYMQEVHHAYDQ